MRKKPQIDAVNVFVPFLFDVVDVLLVLYFGLIQTFLVDVVFGHVGLRPQFLRHVIRFRLDFAGLLQDLVFDGRNHA